MHHAGPLLSPARLQYMEAKLGLLSGFLEPDGHSFLMENFSRHHGDAYLAARRSGRIRHDTQSPTVAPRDGTLRNELLALSAVCNWAMGSRVDGRQLLTHNPVHDVSIPVERTRSGPWRAENATNDFLRSRPELTITGNLGLNGVLP